ncbi:MAG TPA: DUF4340 domain-containing protein [Stellaceae bacterium]|nr:DUF4340 domain-containing protein [Stellaceae bacterium]
MHSKGVITLMAVAALSVVAAAAVSFTSGAVPVDPLAGKPVLPQVKAKPENVAKVIVKRSTGTASFVRQGDIWTVTEKSGYPADAAKVRKMLEGLAEITYVEPKTAEPGLYKRLNVEDPSAEKSQSALVEVYDGQGGALGSVIAGRRRIDELGGGNDGVYVRLPKEARSWLARGTLDLDSDIAQWLDRRIVDVGEKRTKEAVLQQSDGTSLTIARDKPEDKFAVRDLPPNRKLKSDTSMVEPATVLQAFDLTDVKGASEAAFPKDGLSTATFTTFDGLAVKVELAKLGETDWIRLSATALGDDKVKTEADTLNKRWSPWVYGIAPYKATALRTKVEDLLEPPPAPPTPPAGAQSAPATPLPQKK